MDDYRKNELEEVGVASLPINYQTDGTLQNGNELRYSSIYTDTNGVSHVTSDLYFENDPTNTVARQYVAVSDTIAALPDMYGSGNVRTLHQAMAYDTEGVLESLVTQYISDIDNARNLLDQIIYR